MEEKKNKDKKIENKDIENKEIESPKNENKKIEDKEIESKKNKDNTIEDKEFESEKNGDKKNIVNFIVNNHIEAKKLEKKCSKPVKLIILIIILFTLLYVTNLIITTTTTQKVFQNNIDVDLGNNYKITRIIDGVENISYYKDGTFNSILRNGDGGFYIKDNEVYQLIRKNNQYIKLSDSASSYAPNTFLSYIGISKENVESFWDMLSLTFSNNIKAGSETINDKKYTTIEFSDGEKMWVNDETGFIEKETFSGQTTEIKVEKNVVTDDDIKAPWDLGFTEATK